MKPINKGSGRLSTDLPHFSRGLIAFILFDDHFLEANCEQLIGLLYKIDNDIFQFSGQVLHVIDY
ncbi:MAG: hypothetical protein ABFS18_00995 [Thermodesulfobacteriota bacterium]